MSFYCDLKVNGMDWVAWRGGEVALSVADEDFGQFVSLEEYRVRLLGQVNGEHYEDVVDAECCVVGDMTEVRPVFDLERWYGGRYAQDYSEAVYYAVHPKMTNDGITILAMEPDDDGSVLLAIGFGW